MCTTMEEAIEQGVHGVHGLQMSGSGSSDSGGTRGRSFSEVSCSELTSSPGADGEKDYTFSKSSD